MSQDPIVIVGMARTPMGGFMGDLSSLKTTELGSAAIKAAGARAGGTGEDYSTRRSSTWIGHIVQSRLKAQCLWVVINSNGVVFTSHN